jgi:hypothetical protein
MILVYFLMHIHKLSILLYSLSYLPSGRIINRQPGNTLGKILQWYNYLSACRILFILIFIFFLVTRNNRFMFSVILIVMLDRTKKYF